MTGASPDRRPPAIVIGGRVNAVSAVRSLARRGVEVHVLNRAEEPVRHSRLGRWIALGPDDGPEAWGDFLTGPRSEPLAGAVLLACSDEAIRMVIDRHDRLRRRFRLEEPAPVLREALLDKMATYRLAEAIGAPTPRIWPAPAPEPPPGMEFPVIVKPLFSPDAAKLGGRKYLPARDPDALARAVATVERLGIAYVVMEFIEGPDSLSVGYHAYMGEDGEPVFEMTKIQPRRNPPNMGLACYHETRWNPEAAAVGRRFFRKIGFKGYGNLELKRDPRDGRHRIIECNARITAANELLVRCGIDPAVVAYDRLTGRTPPPMPSGAAVPVRRMVAVWEDIAAFRTLRRARAITWGAWLSSLAKVDCTPCFSWRDPGPSLAIAAAKLGKLGRPAKPAPAGVRPAGQLAE